MHGIYDGTYEKNQRVETDENIIFNWVDFGGIKQCPRTWSILAKKISWCRKQFYRVSIAFYGSRIKAILPKC